MFLHVHQGQAIQSKRYAVRKPTDLLGKKPEFQVEQELGSWRNLGLKPPQYL